MRLFHAGSPRCCGGLRLRRAPLLPRGVQVFASSGSSEVGPREHKHAPGKHKQQQQAEEDAAPVDRRQRAKAPKQQQQQQQHVQEEELQEEGDEEEEQFLAQYMNSCIKVYATHCEPNYSLPWQRKRQMTSTSSGFIVAYADQRYLLTNAHSVEYHTQVKVKRRGDDRKYLARVVSIGVDCDIAMLDVDDDSFWAGTTPLEFGPLPRLQDSVAVVGYPIGGDTISVTAGVVSRIEVTDYSHGSTDLLALQIDAAINGGNSGGPVFNRSGQCVGIAFQALAGDDVENVGYVIPTPVVHHFLNDFIKTGGFSGFPALGVQWQRMESEALRRSFRMKAGQKGVLIRNLNPTSYAASVVKVDDVIMKFDGVEISNDGTVPFRTGERIAFSYLISNKYIGDTCSLEVLREGQVHSLTVQLSKPVQLVPPHINNRDPSYFIAAGLVFSVCSEAYLQSEYGSDFGTQSPVKLLESLYYGFPKSEEEELVVLSQVLACEATLGYEDIYNIQLLRFNGTPVSNLRQLAGMVQACTAQYCRFDLAYNEVLIVETDKLHSATREVMRSHSVPYAMSADLRDAGLGPWPAPAPAPAVGAGSDNGQIAVPAAAATGVKK